MALSSAENISGIRDGMSLRKRTIDKQPTRPPRRSYTTDLLNHVNKDASASEMETSNGAICLSDALVEYEIDSPVAEGVLQQLARVLQSRIFSQSEKLSRFLRFIVEHVLTGNPGCLKEYLIGVDVYGRPAPYDPSQDSIVRTEARRLRCKLKEYYEGDGKNDLIYIYLRPGSYIPIFRTRRSLTGIINVTHPEVELSQGSPSIVMAILPFRDLSENLVSSNYARGMADALAYIVSTTQGCTVLSPSWIAHLCNREPNIQSLMNKAQAQVAFEGSIRVEGAILRITARILNANGSQLWAKRVEANGVTEFSFATEEQAVIALSAGLDVVRTAGFSISEAR